ncbi:hypothetical protein AZL_020240 [Azospirillum sp. B510]|uniref:DUF2312 domain-containing protein n=1 Tax=Azospirillum sp. (strain B510) TaxID=137722 RepID=UPI0001C4C36B|nr:DUF2312 domain-containing protein [Azospirillum sp. B510]BAI71492.1 hypothetical protein AZL_008540 [Azospirillum sp. B510]BAI72662.1 hypothetical protein AZL_020240 [Azospirillum sp. B510]
MSDVGGTAAERLRALVTRIRNLRAEIKAIQEDIKAIFAEAKAVGFSTKVMRKIITWMDERERDAASQQEAEAIFDLYKEALGYGEGSNRDIPLNPKPPKGKKKDEAEADPDQTDLEDHLDQSKPDDDGSSDDAGSDQGGAAQPAAMTPEEAKAKGHEDGLAGVPMTANPFAASDPNRAHWELGWCEATGSDGMDIPPELQPPAPEPTPAPNKKGKGGRKGAGSRKPPEPQADDAEPAEEDWQHLDDDFSKRG